MSNNFRRTSEQKTKAAKQRIVLKTFGGVPVPKFLQRFALDFPYICL